MSTWRDRRPPIGRAALIAIALAASSMAGVWAPARGATTFTVNSTDDAADINLADTRCDSSSASGRQCTLRAAIEEANDTAGPDTILFAIQTGGTVKTIAPLSALPAITDTLTVNGFSQPGSSANTLATGNNADLRIQLNGANAGPDVHGLEIDASDSVVRGLIINRFDGNGVHVVGSDNQVRGNTIGTNRAGNTALGNDDGILVFGSGNVIGGTTNAARNLISGNRDDGVDVFGGDNLDNRVQGNYVGTNKTGTAALGNANDGVVVENARGTLVGGTTAATRNVISGNGGDGLELRALSSGPPSVVQGNFIGTDAAGTADVGNVGVGVRFDSASSQTVGGTAAGAGNVISGNASDGLHVVGFDNVIQGNRIGTDATGAAALGNDGNGIQLFFRTLVGGSVAGTGNVISANGIDGIRIGPPGDIGTEITIQGNRIGTRADGTGDLGNVGNGINIHGHDNIVGGPGNAANIISGNDANGVRIASGFARDNIVTGNVLRSNGGRGARIEFGPNTLTGNVILQNGSDGAVVLTSASGVEITGNQIFANGGLGINLSEGQSIGGVTQNDEDDPDSGGNGLQNFPVIASAVRASNGVTTISGNLNSNPETEFRIHLYVAAADPTGHGEGQFPVATQVITTKLSGNRGFTIATTALFPGQQVTMTATNTTTRSTSEFSQNAVVTQAPP